MVILHGGKTMCTIRDSKILMALAFFLMLCCQHIGFAQVPAPSTASALPPKIETKIFAALPTAQRASLSPDGLKISYRRARNGRDEIVVRTVDSNAEQIIDIPEEMDLAWKKWAGNDRLLLGIARPFNFFGVDVIQTSLLAYDVPKKTLAVVGGANLGLDGDDVLYVDPDGAYILQSLSLDLYKQPAVYKIKLADLTMEKIQNSREDVSEWYADDAGQLRMGVGFKYGTLQFLYRSGIDQPFKPIARIRKSDSDAEQKEKLFGLASIVTGSDEGYVLSDEKTGRVALYKFNYLTQEMGEQIYAHDRHDLEEFNLSPDGKFVESVSFVDDQDRIVWLTPAMKKLQSQLSKAVPEHNLQIVSRSRDGNRMLILGSAPNDPGLYYIYDNAKRDLRRFINVQTALPPEWLSETKPIAYKARDGLDIPAYLTLPRGRDPKNLPLIIVPHGGPFGIRDKLGYDPEVQFLANRGYAVLQPNYRGSGGYGTAFFEAGKGQIGRAMQDDLDDGMDWLVKQGISDAKRVCVVGGSYGGYAAVWAITRNPERYRCAASFAGVMDWDNMLKYDRKFLSKKGFGNFSERVKGENVKTLDAFSPYRKAATINRPLLLGHGDQDFTVPISQSKKLVDAMKKAGKNQSLISYKGEGHSFSDPANFQSWLDQMDSFLAQHNPA